MKMEINDNQDKLVYYPEDQDKEEFEVMSRKNNPLKTTDEDIIKIASEIDPNDGGGFMREGYKKE